MTTYTWPEAFGVAEFYFKLRHNVRAIEGAFYGDQTIEFPGSKWQAVMTLPDSSHPDRAAIEAWLQKLRGPANRVNLWHIARPIPRGTLQANTVTNATANQYEFSLSITATTGLTLLAGDMLSVILQNSNVQLCTVAADATAVSNSMSVTLTAPLAWSVASGATVTLVRPTARFRLLDSSGAQYLAGYASQIPIEFIEA